MSTLTKTCAALVAALALQGTALACGTLSQCYQSAASARVGELTTRYTYDRNSSANAVEVENVACTFQPIEYCRYAEGPGPQVLRDYRWSFSGTSDGQGMRYAVRNGGSGSSPRIGGYTTLSSDLVLPTDYSLSWKGGFTLAATVFVSPQMGPVTLFEIQGWADAPLVAIDWIGQRFVVRRRATNDRHSLAVDTPWDLTFDTIETGIAPFKSPAGSYTGLVELYLTFRPDGKLRIDMFTVRERARDVLVEHLQDTGAPVSSYPRQPNNPDAGQNWIEPVYDPAMRVITGGHYRGNPHLLQLVQFNRPLTGDEILGFHRMNLFFGGTEKSSVLPLRPGQRPCNTGEYMNLLQSQSVETVCGSRRGLRISG